MEHVFSVQASTEACSPFYYNMDGKKVDGETDKETRILSKQPNKTRHFTGGFCAHEQQGKEHRHAGHAEQRNLYISPGA